MSDEAKVDEKAVEQQKTVLSLDQFLNQSFECLFNQNVHLHRALAQVLQEEFKKVKLFYEIRKSFCQKQEDFFI